MPDDKLPTPEQAQAIFKEWETDYRAGKLRDTHGEKWSELFDAATPEQLPEPRPTPEPERER